MYFFNTFADIRTGGAGGGRGVLRTGLPATGHGLHREPPHFGGVRGDCFSAKVFIVALLIYSIHIFYRDFSWILYQPIKLFD